MKGKQIVAIDVGSLNVVIAVGAVEDDGNINILGIVSEPINKGVVAGRIENIDMAGRAIAAAKSRIEKQLNIHITEAYAGMAGDYLRCVKVIDHVYVQDDANKQVTQRDVEELKRRMQSVTLPDDKEEIVSMEPLSYNVDGKVVEEPCGNYGRMLEATYNFVLCEKSIRDRLRDCLKRQGITVKEFVPNAMISHLGVATSEEIVDGAIIIDLGGGITDVTVLQGGKVRHAASIPIGADAINDDIRSLSIPVKYVEDLKVGYGSALAERSEDDIITFQAKYHSVVKSILRRNLVTAIEARLMDIAELVQREIKEAKCGSRFMPAVLITGGGSRTLDIERLFARELKYEDVRAVYPEYGITQESAMEHITTPAYSMVTSLLLYGAKRGLCAVAVVPAQSHPVTPVPPVTPSNNVTTPAAANGVKTTTPAASTTTATSSATTSATTTPNEASMPIEQVSGTLTVDGTEQNEGNEASDIVQKPNRFTNFVNKIFGSVSKTMSDDNDQDYL